MRRSEAFKRGPTSFNQACVNVCVCTYLCLCGGSCMAKTFWIVRIFSRLRVVSVRLRLGEGWKNLLAMVRVRG